jgi:hypothetical protein
VRGPTGGIEVAAAVLDAEPGRTTTTTPVEPDPDGGNVIVVGTAIPALV